MSKPPGSPGLYQVSKAGKRKTRNKATVAQLAEAASKPRPKGRQMKAGPNAGNPAGLWGKPIPKGRRCQFINKAGHQCKRWAIVGGRRCWDHGGLLDNPNHPSAPRWIAEIEAEAARIATNREIRTYDPHTVQAVREAAQQRGASPSGPELLNGLKALAQDDSGKAWRRWLSHLTAPATHQRARKHT